jgi:uncharacterized membrane protein
MSERWERSATAAVALCGVAVAAYLSYTRLTDTSIICPTTGCGTVQRSEYAKLAGVPVAYLGVAGYAAIAVTTLNGRRAARVLRTALVIVAAGFAGYLLVAQLFLIDAVCVWCIGSDVVALSLVVLTARPRRASTRRLREGGPAPGASHRESRSAR